MNRGPFEDIVSALLSMQRALYGMAAPSLRAVTVNLDMEKEVYICRFFYDGFIDDDLFDLPSCTSAEASDCWFCDVGYLRLDFPNPIPVNGFLAYLRKESDELPPQISLLPKSHRSIAKAYLSYALQQGLLGRVISSLRAVIVNVDEEKNMHFSFSYDEETTDELITLSKEAIAKKAFPETFSVREGIIFVPFSERIFCIDGWVVYRRYEPDCSE